MFTAYLSPCVLSWSFLMICPEMQVHTRVIRCTTIFYGRYQEKMRGQRGRLRALAGICHVHESYFLDEVCLPRRPHEQTSSPLRPPLHEIFAFLSNIRPRLTCMRTSRKTSTRLKITFVDMTYPKGWTGSLPLCPLIFSWRYKVSSRSVPQLKHH